VQTDKARARFQDGVREIRIPKTEEARKKSRKVAIE
jgi:HSP20 family protein